jgi:predicted nucleotidyltransferase
VTRSSPASRRRRPRSRPRAWCTSPCSARAPAATPGDSDLDVVIEFDLNRDIDWKNLTGVYRRLEQATGLGINLVDRAALRPRLAARIADDLVRVF